MTHPEPPGLTFFDDSLQRRCLLVQQPGHEWQGWLFLAGPYGQWFRFRKATEQDFLAIELAIQDNIMNSNELLTRTPEETVARIVELGNIQGADMFGVERSRLLDSLPYDHALQFLDATHSHTPDTWEVTRIKDSAMVIKQMRDYLGFAWIKANAGRSMSTHRAMSHFKGLLWLLGSDCDELRMWIEDPDNYEYYSKTALVKVSEMVSFDWKHPDGPDDDEWRTSAEGVPITATEALAQE